MIYALTFTISLLLFAFIGYRKGIVKLSFSLLSLIGAYVTAILFTASLGSYFNESSQIDGVLGYILAGFCLFFFTNIILRLVFKIIEKIIEQKWGETPSQPSRIAGSISGAIMGGVIGVFLVWGVSSAGQLLEKNSTPLSESASLQEPGFIESMANELAGSALKTAITTTTDEPEVAEFAAQILSSPKESIKSFQSITQSKEFQNLFTNYQNQQALNSRDPIQIKQLPDFNQLLRNPQFRKVSQETFKISGDVSYDDKMADLVLDMWGRAQFIKNDPETQQMINDANLKQFINDGDILKLLNSQKVVELFKRILSKEASEYSMPPQINDSSTRLIRTTEESVKSSQLYRWVDEQGVVHYSDEKPESQK